MGDFPGEIGMDFESFLQLGRTRPENPHEPFVMTPLGIKMSRSANGVSRRHGEVARQMWQPLFPERPVDTVPIGHVTNGVHLPTWMAPATRALLDRHLEDGWVTRAADPQTWAAVENIPDAELWALRCRLRGEFVEYVRDRSVATRLARSEDREMVAAAERGFSADALTIGFARRLATYKRLYLLTLEPHRVADLISNLERPMQMILAGKAHPNDEEGKRSAQGVFSFKELAHAAERVAFLDNYDLGIASQLVAGCDLWVNLPAPTAGGERHQWHEVSSERRPQPLRPRRLVGGGVRRAPTAGPSPGTPRTTPACRTRATRPPSTTCWSTRWRRSSTRATATACPTSGYIASSAHCAPTARAFPRPAWSRTTSTAPTCCARPSE